MFASKLAIGIVAPHQDIDYLCFVGSTRRNVPPGFSVGGSGLPRTAVTSAPFAPLGPISWYCPDTGVDCPGRKPDGFFIADLHNS